MRKLMRYGTMRVLSESVSEHVDLFTASAFVLMVDGQLHPVQAFKAGIANAIIPATNNVPAHHLAAAYNLAWVMAYQSRKDPSNFRDLARASDATGDLPSVSPNNNGGINQTARTRLAAAKAMIAANNLQLPQATRLAGEVVQLEGAEMDNKGTQPMEVDASVNVSPAQSLELLQKPLPSSVQGAGMQTFIASKQLMEQLTATQELKAAHTMIQGLRDLEAQSRCDLAKVNMELGDTIKQRDLAEDACRRMKAENENLQTELHELRKASEAAMQEVTKERDSAQADCMAMKAENETLQRDICNLRETSEAAAEKVRKERDWAKEACMIAEIVRKEMTDSRDVELNQLRGLNGKLQQDAQDLRIEIDGWKKKVEMAKGELNDPALRQLRQQYDELKQDNYEAFRRLLKMNPPTQRAPDQVLVERVIYDHV